jgi:hypothetical protein
MSAYRENKIPENVAPGIASKVNNLNIYKCFLKKVYYKLSIFQF